MSNNPFLSIDVQYDKNVKYNVYKVPENSMILMSKTTGKVLAGLTFSPKIPEVRTIICEPTSGLQPQKFYGLIDKNEQKIQLGITNFTDMYINFNIMLTDEKVTTVNPKGLNQVNELRPNEHYWIESDQNNDNRAITLIRN